MATTTQYNPNVDLNNKLLNAGLSKTVYAVVTPETEEAKYWAFGLGDCCEEVHAEYLSMFREAWTGKQDAYHEEFFNDWHTWSAPMVDLDRENFPFYYPCNGASEPIRHLIYAAASGGGYRSIHAFDGEYEGYRAMAEAARIPFVAHPRDQWREINTCIEEGDLFFVSAPSAIDGNVWSDFNAFLETMPPNSVVADCTYVGAVPSSAVRERFNLNAPSVHSVIFSLSKPFGVYYDRIGGIWTREEDLGLFGNKWFKNLNSIRLGSMLLRQVSVFEMAARYGHLQRAVAEHASEVTGLELVPSDVFIIATAPSDQSDMGQYLARAGRARVCLTSGMSDKLTYRLT